MAASAELYSATSRPGNAPKTLLKVNLVFLGEPKTGKTALVNRFMHDAKNEILFRVEVDSSKKTLIIKDHGLHLHLFDSSGLERHRSTISSYIQKSTAFIVVYDVTDSTSFSHASKWVDVVRSEHGNNSIIVLCGNKIELKDKREVSTEDGEVRANELHTMFIETSAVAGPNVTIIFRKVVKAILNSDFNSTKEEESTGCRII